MGMSSKRAAQRALTELLELLANLGTGDRTVLRSYQRMRPPHLYRQNYYRKLRRFQRHGLIKRVPAAGGSAFVITAKAKSLRRQAVVKKNRTDGLATLIIFDIPEEKRRARDTLRRYLVRSGYTQIRESTFLSPFQIFSELKQLIGELKLAKNISIFGVKPEYYFRPE